MKNLEQVIKPGAVTAVPCRDMPTGLAAIRSELDRLGFTVVTLNWDFVVPPLEALISQTVRGLARLALALWPAWSYPSDLAPDYSEYSPVQPDVQPPQAPPLQAPPLEAPPDQISTVWRQTAGRYCEAGQLPIPNGYPSAVQVSQLTLTFTAAKLNQPPGLAIIIAVDSLENPDLTADHHLIAQPAPGEPITSMDEGSIAMILRSAAEWLAENARSPVLVCVPSIAVRTARLAELVPIADFFDCGTAASAAQDTPRLDVNPGTEAEQPRVDIFPVTGAPHPLSPGERKLAARLRTDLELAPLFAFNRRIKGRHGNEYIVDLVWPSGKLIVEVDSFPVHGNRYAFRQDRHRDYELMAANYRILRITDDEAAGDTESAVEKIRQLVRLVGESSNGANKEHSL
ncbi:MAG TPA: DUF559 domain-containing protein [Blastocatellia bacterium]|nr:DUF559 domain-containing protein [Blastocatellia bacterium]